MKMTIPLNFVGALRSIFHQETIRVFAKSYSTQQLKVWKQTKSSDTTMPPSRSDPVIIKLDTSEFKSIFTPELKVLTNLFEKYNHELRIAGGAVRDLITGLIPKDLDFATTATPDQMKDLFTQENIRMINAKGERHGTITARINDNENFEVTTLRVDVLTNGRHAQVEWTKNWKLDANRRDLTINSMFLDFQGNVYDYFYGYDDLKNKKVVFVGSASIRIQEDYLRILRYFRFHGRICEDPKSHDEITLNAIKDNINGLEMISGERIWNEFSKILLGQNGGELTVLMLDCGLGPRMGLPDTVDTENFKRVYNQAKSQCIQLRPISLVCSLLKNDVQVKTLHDRLKLSAYERDLGFFLVNHKDAKNETKALRPYQELIVLSSINPGYIEELLKYQGELELLNKFNEWYKVAPKFPIDGHMLKQSVPRGKLVGLVLKEMKLTWLDNDFQINREQLLKSIPDIIARLEGNKKIDKI